MWGHRPGKHMPEPSRFALLPHLVRLSACRARSLARFSPGARCAGHHAPRLTKRAATAILYVRHAYWPLQGVWQGVFGSAHRPGVAARAMPPAERCHDERPKHALTSRTSKRCLSPLQGHIGVGAKTWRGDVCARSDLCTRSEGEAAETAGAPRSRQMPVHWAGGRGPVWRWRVHRRASIGTRP